MAGKIINAAKLLSRRSHILPDQLQVSELFFEVPADYSNPPAGTLKLFGRSVTKHERPIVPLSSADATKADQKPWLVYLEGGPGFGNREPQDMPLTRLALTRGYQVLFLDYRGVGSSTPISAASVKQRAGTDAASQAAYLRLFRQDSIVNDCEAVRACLTEGYPAEKRPWSIFGQSFGGFVALTYLSRFPQGLREVFLTGGLAPLDKTPDQVYEATFERVTSRNEAYYKKYPEDVRAVREIARHIASHEGASVPLPAGGDPHHRPPPGSGARLRGRRRAQLGTDGGRQADKCERVGEVGRAGEGASSHLLLPSAGVALQLGAHRVGSRLAPYAWLDSATPLVLDEADDDREPLYFSGEMIFPFHLDTHPELRLLKPAADLLAAHAEWPALYDLDQLRRNDVPVYAASYVDDMYVDSRIARETAAAVRGCKVFETNTMYHNALRAKTGEVLGELFKLRDNTID
ncbi:proline iminopeptidase [Verticillium dahliae VdLs.17]|uniref:Proline iminopeptidase n=1 Tax=Verticillium dahliae (strain VdLs.17 / ATCC MYA-4575 / FGSC 10137) TaxID=498257 RepID=G2X1V9_VERDV|nr:proline iminopeptidase [Verticillium dahliae VdLs.17]EGY22845.1 proline iminopeptidase [Verticillium dahliae VdLs.17]